MENEMNQFLYNDIAAHRMDRLQNEAAHRRMANAAKAAAMPRSAHSLRDALGHGLIALGSKLTEPPSADNFDYDKAA
jgi:hypothetical protein